MAPSPSIRVLLADDQPDVIDMLSYAFSVYGSFEVVGRAGNGRMAVELARGSRPDVAVIDLMMPDLDGFQAIAIIRAELPSTRIAVLSAVDDLNSRRAASEAGADLFLVKGVVPREIARLLADLVLATRPGVG